MRASLTTILRGLPGLVVALLVAVVGNRGDVWLGAARVAVTTSQIAVAQTAPSSGPPTAISARAKRVSRLPSTLSELPEEAELEDGREDPSASVLPSVRIALESRSKGAVRSGGGEPGSILLSQWMPTGHPRGPPAARLG